MDDDPAAWSIKRLKATLLEHRVSCVGITEKAELVDRVRVVLAAPPAAAPAPPVGDDAPAAPPNARPRRGAAAEVARVNAVDEFDLRVETLPSGPGSAFKRTTPASERCKSQPKRCSYGRDRFAPAGTTSTACSTSRNARPPTTSRRRTGAWRCGSIRTSATRGGRADRVGGDAAAATDARGDAAAATDARDDAAAATDARMRRTDARGDAAADTRSR